MYGSLSPLDANEVFSSILFGTLLGGVLVIMELIFSMERFES